MKIFMIPTNFPNLSTHQCHIKSNQTDINILCPQNPSQFKKSHSPAMTMAAPSPSSNLRELHVLAVDDSLVDRKVIEQLLKISSCKVTAVDSGTRALQYLGLDGKKKSSVGFDELKVHMIMTDYSMPGMTGYELLKKIKESSAFRAVPVVIMSSENILTRIDRCMEEGAEEYLVKPVKLADVTRLKDCIMRGEVEEHAVMETCKKNLNDNVIFTSLSESLASSLLKCNVSSLQESPSLSPVSSVKRPKPHNMDWSPSPAEKKICP